MKGWRRFGTNRIPLMIHLMGVLDALGIVKWDPDQIWAAIDMQAARPQHTWPRGTKRIGSRYKKVSKFRGKARAAFMTQFRAMWAPKQIRRNSKRHPSNMTQPPPPPENPVEARVKPFGRWPKPPVSVNGVDVEEVVEQVLQPTVSNHRKAQGMLKGFEHSVCVAVRFLLPGDVEEIVSSIQTAFKYSTPFAASLIEYKSMDRADGHWLYLLIQHNIGLADLYKLVLNCELIKDVEARPPTDFGKRHAKQVL